MQFESVEYFAIQTFLTLCATAVLLNVKLAYKTRIPWIFLTRFVCSCCVPLL
jgi:hypothetical protein